jgi:hypothetical protein
MPTKDIYTFYPEASYWHGTGRYKYTKDGDIVDILKGMIAEGGVIPHDDDWDWKLGKIQSISLARSRMYARLYAGMYMPDGKRIEHEYGPRWLWFHYFVDTARIAAILEHFSPYGLLTDYQYKLTRWARKITVEPRRKLFSVFKNGTDIEHNYPILIGIRGTAIQPLVGARVFNLHEARSASPIGFKDMTHIEVPQAYVAETTALLRDAGIQTPVIPIEDGETYCREFSFFALVSGRPLRQRVEEHLARK